MLTKDIVKEYQSADMRNDRYDLLAIIRKTDESGDIEEAIRVISHIGQDVEEEECLLIVEPAKKPLKAFDAINQISSINQEFRIYLCYEIELDDGWARVRVPVKGFEENADRKHFYVACGA